VAGFYGITRSVPTSVHRGVVSSPARSGQCPPVTLNRPAVQSGPSEGRVRVPVTTLSSPPAPPPPASRRRAPRPGRATLRLVLRAHPRRAGAAYAPVPASRCFNFFPTPFRPLRHARPLRGPGRCPPKHPATTTRTLLFPSIAEHVIPKIEPRDAAARGFRLAFKSARREGCCARTLHLAPRGTASPPGRALARRVKRDVPLPFSLSLSLSLSLPAVAAAAINTAFSSMFFFFFFPIFSTR